MKKAKLLLIISLMLFIISLLNVSADFSCWCTAQSDCPSDWTWSGGEGYCSPQGFQCCTPKSGTPPGDPGVCSITYPEGINGCVHISQACGQVTFNRFHEPATQNLIGSGCFTSKNKEIITLGPGRHCPSTEYACGQCVQYDEVSGPGGVAQYTGNCPVPVQACGNAIKEGTEQCDNGVNNGKVPNVTYGDSKFYCTTSCTTKTVVGPKCGDKIIQPQFEQCDDGNNNNNDGCSSVCKLEVCGDTIKQSSEQCDDGNKISGDGCSNVCKIEFCGDSIKQPALGEQCDRGNNNSNSCNAPYGGICDFCTIGTCQLKTNKGPFCGDRIVQPGKEQCEFNNQCNDNNPKTQDSCNSCSCQHVQICQDECAIGEKICKPGQDLWECGNFDNDPCTEFGFKKSCDFTQEGQTVYQCVNGDSAGFKDVTTGFCNDKPGKADFCDSKKETVKVSQQTCAKETCSEEEFCKNNDVYTSKECTIGGCSQNTGLCFLKDTKEEKLKEDCGSSQTSGEFCDGQNIVKGTTERGCKESNNDAFCFSKNSTQIISVCGPDTCTPFTNKDPLIKEYVNDQESCNLQFPVCSMDPGNIFDFCSGDIVQQAVCLGNDHSFEPFNCNQLDGCFDFTFQKEVVCEDYYGCGKKTVTKTGKEFRDYSCGSGKCSFTINTVDVDNDRVDDRCDNCIDVDHDKICDNADNCPYVPNNEQVDSDNDGIGNSCDLDRDNDGYNSDVDCNDWKPEIKPGAKEIPNNGIDDDCDLGTEDNVANSPRQVLFVDIAMTDEAQIRAGKEMTLVVSAKNNGEETLRDVEVSVSVPGFQFREAKLLRTLRPGRSEARVFTIDIPEYASEYEYLLITVSNDNIKRRIYRELRIY